MTLSFSFTRILIPFAIFCISTLSYVLTIPTEKTAVTNSDDEIFEENKDSLMLLKPTQKAFFREILVLGDSLLVVPEMFYNFTSLLQEHIAHDHDKFDVEVSAIMKGGLTIMDISKLIHQRFQQRQKYKKPFPDAIVYHTNSDYLDLVISPEQYQLRLERLLLYLKRRVTYIMIIGPGLYTPNGELIELWEDHSQRMVRDIIDLQVDSCKKVEADHVNFREIMQEKLRAAAKDGKISRDLSDMIGQKKEWKVEAENEKKSLTTYDYKSKGGIYFLSCLYLFVSLSLF